MGIFKAATGSVGGVMADQWLEVFTCDSMPVDVLAMRGVRKTGDRSANVKGEKEVISDGSTIIVSDGQCAIAVDRGEIIGVYDTPGENTFHSDRSKSIFHKGGLKGIAKQSWERFGYGGVAAVYQIIMYLDLKEHHSNLFRVTRTVNIKDRHHLTEMDINVTMAGMFSFRIVDPVAFYRNICGNAAGTVKVSMVLPQLQAELASALGEALSRLCSDGALSPTDISARSEEVAAKIAQAMTALWTEKRGFAVCSLAVSEVDIAQADRGLLQGLERDKVFTDPRMGAAHLTAAQGDAMRIAAANPAGRVGMIAAVPPPKPVNPLLQKNDDKPSLWRCSCGNMNTSKFCENCGQKKP